MALRKWKSHSYQIDIRFRDRTGGHRRYRFVLPPGMSEQDATRTHAAIHGYLLKGFPAPTLTWNNTLIDWRSRLPVDIRPTITIGDLIDQYRGALRTLKPMARVTTLESEAAVLNVIQIRIGSRGLRELQAAIGDHLLWAATERSSSTARHHYMVIEWILRFARDRELLDPAVDPLKNLKKPKIVNDEPNPLRGDEIRQFLEVSRCLAPAFAGAWEFALLTGLRQGELHGLQWKDFCEADGYIHVQRRIDSRGRTAPPKSGRPRRVPLVSRAHEILLSHTRGKHSDPIFQSPRGVPLTRTAYRTLFQKTVTAMHRPYGMTFHDLRHTYGAANAQAGVPLPRLQAWMGHSDIKTTMIYAKLADLGVGFDVDLHRLERFVVNGWSPLTQTSPNLNSGSSVTH